ncbi:YNFM family putative membrane transporter [Scopulibacillus darangshiensis]|uniref:YNFM family putative membrane transporter n=1 Tax=Scopulibacillus darangshiensis TaxID=442528 RepID=A0A4R2P5P2_9BACL|nr:MFS transporter [Scopulibacillus darangshiensis]TCP30180.1 YNFM family putative membrane transporter [Scopulibacillus darangshiensis]
MTYIEHGKEGYWRANLALFLGGFVTFSLLYTTQPLMPVFSKAFHISPAAASLSLSLSTGALAVFMLIAAALSDTLGRKKIMVFSMFAASLITILTAFSLNFTDLLILRAVLGIMLAGVPSLAMTYVSEEFHPRSLGTAMGLYVSGNSIGGMYGRIAVGGFTDLFSWHIALVIMGGISFILSFFFWKGLPESRHFEVKKVTLRRTLTTLGGHLKNSGLLSIFFIAFTIMGGFVTLFNYIGYLLSEEPYSLSQGVIGSLFIVYLTGTFSSAWLGKRADVKGHSYIIKLSLAIMLLGVVLTIVPSLIIKIVGIAVFTFGFFGAHSVASSWVGERARHNKAQASSLYLLFYYLGSSLVGSFGGFFWSHMGWGGVSGLIIGLIIIAFGLTYFSASREKNEFRMEKDIV